MVAIVDSLVVSRSERSKRLFRVPAAAAALLFALTVVGCSADSPIAPAGPSDDTATQSEVDETEASDDEGNDGRVFDSTDDAVVTAVEAALKSKNAKAEWDGSTLRVHMDGSANDPTAGLFCSTIDVLVADDENGIFVYSDGEFPCE